MGKVKSGQRDTYELEREVIFGSDFSMLVSHYSPLYSSNFQPETKKNTQNK